VVNRHFHVIRLTSCGLFVRCMSLVLADFVAEVGDYYARGLPRFVDTSSYYAAFGER